MHVAGMSKPEPLSREMASCMYQVEAYGGKLVRHPGGY